MAENTDNNKKEKWIDPEKLRLYRLKKGAHKLKNRSSKDILRINHCNNIDSYRSMSNDALNAMANNGDFKARIELDRRRKKADKKTLKNQA